MGTPVDYTAFSSSTGGRGVSALPWLAPINLGAVARHKDLPVPSPDEPLVDASLGLRCLACYERTGWAGTSPATWLRATVVERLARVQRRLTAGVSPRYGLAVFDGWRSPETVRALHAHYYGPGSDLPPGYLADPDADGVAPHLTGGAVDLTLTVDGEPLSIGTPFDEFSPRASLVSLEDIPDDHPDRLDRDLRRLLFWTMTSEGFAPYVDEWWHFSYGDEAWARWHGTTGSYGETAPLR